MGCGQSHIAVIYPRKSKQKGSSSSPDIGEDNSDDENRESRLVGNDNEGAQNDDPVNDDSTPGVDDDEAARMRQMVQLAGNPLLAHQELSTSQSEFFKMLDEKINNGPDYDGSGDFEFALDHAKLCRMLQEWQTAKHKTTRYNAYGHNPLAISSMTPPPSQVQASGHPPSAYPLSTMHHHHHHQQQHHHHHQQQQHQQSLYKPNVKYSSVQNNCNGDPSVMLPSGGMRAPPSSRLPPHQITAFAPAPPPQFSTPIAYDPYAGARQYAQVPPSYMQPAYHHQITSNSVVMYDKSRGGYYTELA